VKLDPNMPAFPQHGWSSDPKVREQMRHQGGMTYRQWLVGTIAAGYAANHAMVDTTSRMEVKGGDRMVDLLAKLSVAQADSIIAALNEEDGK